MSFRRLFFACFSFAASFVCGSVNGDLLVHEGFDYPPGSLQGRNGGLGWAGPYESFGGRPSGEVIAPKGGEGLGPGNFAKFIQDSYHFRGIDTLAIAREHVNERGTLGVPGTSLWLSVFIQAERPILPPFFGLSLFEDGEEKLFLGKGRMEQAGWKIQTRATETNFLNIFRGSYVEPHWIVMRIDLRNDGSPGADLDRILMFLNPDPEGPAPLIADAAGEISEIFFPLSFNRIRLVGNGHGFRMDDLRIGTTFASISPAVEPGTIITTR